MARVKLKHLDRGKSSHISPGKGIPSNQEGKDGDLTIRVLPNIGLKLFGKYGGKWYTIGDTFYKIIRGGGPGSLPKEPVKPSPRSNFVGNKGKLEMRDDIHLAADGLRLYLDKEKNVYISSDGTNLDLVGVLNISGDLVVGGGDISGPADGSLTLKADTDMIFQVDSDNDGTETFQFKNGAGTEILTITEDGMVTADSTGLFTSGVTITGYDNLPAGIVMNADNNDDDGDSWTLFAYANDSFAISNNKSGSHQALIEILGNATPTDTVVDVTGKLKVGGNIIQASDGGNTITMDTSDNVIIAGDLTVSGGDIKTVGTTHINVEASAHDAVGNDLSIVAGYPIGGTTNNIAGGSLVLAGGRGKGSGDGGHIYLKVANAGGSGSTLNSLVTEMEIEDSGNVLLTGETLQSTNSTSQKPEIKLISSGAHNKPPTINFVKNRGGTSTSDNDYVMQIVANGYDDSNNTQIYGSIQVQCLDNTHTSEDGELTITIATGGGTVNAIKATGTGSTIANLSLANGATSIVDLAGHLETIADGKIYLGPNANNDYIYSDGTEINVAKDDGDVIIIKDDQTQFETPLKITESAAAVSDTAGKGQIWVKNDTPNNLYFTNDAGNDVQITNGASLAGGGSSTQYWHQMVGGYKLNLTSTTLYYTIYRIWYENWSNSDSSPTSVTSTDAYSAFMIAPRAGSITNIKIQGRTSDTGATDPFRFYFFKMGLSSDETTKTATAMMTTAIITPPTSGRTWSHTEDFSSSNTFSEDDNLYVWIKKDSNTGNQDLYFNLCINGEYS